MIKSIKLKTILCFILICVFGIFISIALVGTIKASNASLLNYTIVIDAGHGGLDGGSEGVATGVWESEINLKVAKKLESMLKKFGFKVVLTRTGADGLYSQLAKNKKQDDMLKRKQIITRANADMVVSIHMNSYPNQHEKGAQAFYQTGYEQGLLLAEYIQKEMQKNLVDARQITNFSDLYILKCINKPSVLVEGGFLSNPQEEALLITDEYQYKMAYSVFCGIIKYYAFINNAPNFE